MYSNNFSSIDWCLKNYKSWMNSQILPLPGSLNYEGLFTRKLFSWHGRFRISISCQSKWKVEQRKEMWNTSTTNLNIFTLNYSKINDPDRNSSFSFVNSLKLIFMTRTCLVSFFPLIILLMPFKTCLLIFVNKKTPIHVLFHKFRKI